MQIDNGHEDPLALDGVDGLPLKPLPKIVGEKDSATRRQTPDVIEEALSTKGQDVEWWKDYINEMAKKRLIDELVRQGKMRLNSPSYSFFFLSSPNWTCLRSSKIPSPVTNRLYKSS